MIRVIRHDSPAGPHRIRLVAIGENLGIHQDFCGDGWVIAVLDTGLGVVSSASTTVWDQSKGPNLKQITIIADRLLEAGLDLPSDQLRQRAADVRACCQPPFRLPADRKSAARIRDWRTEIALADSEETLTLTPDRGAGQCNALN